MREFDRGTRGWFLRKVVLGHGGGGGGMVPRTHCTGHCSGLYGEYGIPLGGWGGGGGLRRKQPPPVQTTVEFPNVAATTRCAASVIPFRCSRLRCHTPQQTTPMKTPIPSPQITGKPRPEPENGTAKFNSSKRCSATPHVVWKWALMRLGECGQKKRCQSTAVGG